MIKRILLHVNGSKSSQKALDYALYLAKELKAGLTALYVITVKAPKQLEPSNVPKEPAREAEAFLQGVKAKADSAGLAITTKIMASRSPGDAITEEATRGDYDIIVVSPSNGGGIFKLLSRSPSDEVVRRAPKPVLVIK